MWGRGGGGVRVRPGVHFGYLQSATHEAARKLFETLIYCSYIPGIFVGGMYIVHTSTYPENRCWDPNYPDCPSKSELNTVREEPIKLDMATDSLVVVVIF